MAHAPAGRTPFKARLFHGLRRLHRWLTYLMAAPLLVLSLSGALLVFGHEIEGALAPHVWHVEPRGEPLSHRTLLERVRQQKPDIAVWSISAGETPADAWTLWLAGGAGVMTLDPYTGAILSQHHPHGTVRGTLVALHRWLLVDGSARPWARHLVSAVALAMMVQVLVGLWLWSLPPRPWRNAVPDFSRSARLAVSRLHQATGLATAALLLMVAFTGMAMYWTTPTRALVEAVTASRVPANPEPAAHAPAPVADLDAAVAAARAALPHGRARHVRIPAKPDHPAVVSFDTPGTLVPSHAIVGGTPPRVLALQDGREASAAGWFWAAHHHLHMGDFAGGALGTAVRAVWVLLALIPAAFVASGLWLHARRRPSPS
ncbi:PepSY-associated TM helix domain-containing protein [Azospirillum sp.]|uniref:PepSY-associated TM helix domain-containing protein n=1 Tax=Azospirillum sp. TaxID=34012 RepID=UPI002D4CA61A|nr:PepSY-associated TM helix domain-containing protein [Azospirillum sp.]HYD64384.1 PepSY-associated TM helix domain-containing protein [Azospirillum sp.]